MIHFHDSLVCLHPLLNTSLSAVPEKNTDKLLQAYSALLEPREPERALLDSSPLLPVTKAGRFGVGVKIA